MGITAERQAAAPAGAVLSYTGGPKQQPVQRAWER